MNNLLPPNATPQEVALAGTTERIDAIPVRSRQMWNAQTCPADLLPWLAWALSVDEWNADWSEQQKRDTIAASFVIHSTKGTLAAVKASLAALGYDSTVIEWFQQPNDLEPYTFTVDIDAALAPVSGDIFAESTRLIGESKNTRSHLARLRVASSAPVQIYGAVAQTYGVYCAAGGALSVVGGRPKLLKANALAMSSALANLTFAITRYFALGNGTGDVRFYKIDGQTFTQLATPADQPTVLVYGVDFSPNADYAAVFANAAPRLFIYKRAGDVFTKLPDPAVLPTNGAGRATFSPDGMFLACPNSSANDGVSVYQRSGDTFTKLSGVVMGVFQIGLGTVWNSGGDLLAIAVLNVQPYIYSRTGSTFTKLGFPTTALPISANAMAFSPASDLLVCGHAGSPYVSVSSVTGSVHTRHADPAVLPTSQVNAVAFNHDGSVVAVASNSGLFIYSVVGTTLTRISNPSGAPATALSVAFNHDGTILTVGVTSTPFVYTYAVSGTTFTPITNPPSIPAQAVRALDFSS